MIKYWPKATFWNEKNELKALSTYDLLSTMEKSVEVLMSWINKGDPEIVEAWIDVYNDHILVEEINVFPIEDAEQQKGRKS